MEEPDDPRPACPHDVADPRSSGPRADDLRRQGSRHVVPADRAAAPARGGTERARHPPRRRRLRCLERVRRAVPHPDRRAAGRRRSALQPLPHDGAVRTDAPGAADRAQPPLGRDGQHHRDRHVGSRQQLAAPEHQGAAGDDPEAERVLDGPVRQVPRGAGVADVADGAVRRVAVGRWRVRDVLRLHRRREQPVGAGPVRAARRRSSRPRRPRRATTSPRTSPTTPSAGCASRRR